MESTAPWDWLVGRRRERLKNNIPISGLKNIMGGKPRIFYPGKGRHKEEEIWWEHEFWFDVLSWRRLGPPSGDAQEAAA